jgi:hypothetical protein
MSGPVHLQPGAVFARDFRIESPLRTGGMGAVYVATQLSTGTRRAIKLMLPSFAADDASRRRFEQEARVGARIASEHVVQVIGAGVDDETGAPWIGMELLQGEELMDRVRRAGPLGVAETRALFEQLCHAIGAAHRARVVHRDLKPENIFLALPRSAGAVPFNVKVLDFGIAKVTSEAITMNTGSVGTPIWMAPEQTSPGHEITAATDVWALGLIAYYALTGRYFWRAASDTSASLTALLREVLVEPIQPASERAAEHGVLERLPRGFDAWFARCIARDAAARFPDADAAHAALDPLLRGEGAAGAPVHREEHPEPAAGLPRRKRSPGLALGLGALVVLAGGIAVAMATRASAPAARADPSVDDPRAVIAGGALAWQDLVLPQWSGSDDPCDTSGPAVVITPTAVLAGSPPARLFTLTGHEAPPQVKRPGSLEPYLLPVGDALRRARADRVLFIADAATQYRLLYEGLATVAQAGTSRWDLVVAHDGRPRSFALYPPGRSAPRPDRSVMVVALADRFEAYIGRTGDAGKPVWAPLAAKCEQEGATLVPLRDSSQVTDCLAAVQRTFGQGSTTATGAGPLAAVVSADADVPYGRVLVAVAALRQAFGNVEFAPP